MQNLANMISLDKIQYLGDVVTKEGISIDPKKIKAIEECPVPKDVTDV